MGSVNVYRLTSDTLMKYEALRRAQDATWDLIDWEENELILGDGGSDNETHVNIVNTNPAYKELIEAQKTEVKEFVEKGQQGAGYCDVVFVAEDGYVPVHWTYLHHARSPFLETIIAENLKIATRDTRSVMITLAGSKVRHLRIVLSLLYTGETWFFAHEEDEIKCLLRMLQIDHLKTSRSRFDPKTSSKPSSKKAKKPQLPRLILGFRFNQSSPNQNENNRVTETIDDNNSTISDLSAVPGPSSSMRGDIPLPEIRNVPRGTLLNTLQPRMQRTSGNNQEEPVVKPPPPETEAVSQNPREETPSERMEIRKVPPGTLIPLHKQPRIKRNLPPEEPSNSKPPSETGSQKAKKGKAPAPAAATVTAAAANETSDVEDIPCPTLKSRYEMDNEYVPSGEEESDNPDVDDGVIEVSSGNSLDDFIVESDEDSDTPRRPRTRRKTKEAAAKGRSNRSRYPRRSRRRTTSRNGNNDDGKRNKRGKLSDDEDSDEGRSAKRRRSRRRSGSGRRNERTRSTRRIQSSDDSASADSDEHKSKTKASAKETDRSRHISNASTDDIFSPVQPKEKQLRSEPEPLVPIKTEMPCLEVETVNLSEASVTLERLETSQISQLIQMIRNGSNVNLSRPPPASGIYAFGPKPQTQTGTTNVSSAITDSCSSSVTTIVATTPVSPPQPPSENLTQSGQDQTGSVISSVVNTPATSDSNAASATLNPNTVETPPSENEQPPSDAPLSNAIPTTISPRSSAPITTTSLPTTASNSTQNDSPLKSTSVTNVTTTSRTATSSSNPPQQQINQQNVQSSNTGPTTLKQKDFVPNAPPSMIFDKSAFPSIANAEQNNSINIVEEVAPAPAMNTMVVPYADYAYTNPTQQRLTIMADNTMTSSLTPAYFLSTSAINSTSSPQLQSHANENRSYSQVVESSPMTNQPPGNTNTISTAMVSSNPVSQNQVIQRSMYSNVHMQMAISNSPSLPPPQQYIESYQHQLQPYSNSYSTPQQRTRLVLVRHLTNGPMQYSQVPVQQQLQQQQIVYAQSPQPMQVAIPNQIRSTPPAIQQQQQVSGGVIAQHPQNYQGAVLVHHHAATPAGNYATQHASRVSQNISQPQPQGGGLVVQSGQYPTPFNSNHAQVRQHVSTIVRRVNTPTVRVPNPHAGNSQMVHVQQQHQLSQNQHVDPVTRLPFSSQSASLSNNSVNVIVTANQNPQQQQQVRQNSSGISNNNSSGGVEGAHCENNENNGPATGPNRLECPECGLRFENENNLTRHRNTGLCL